MVVTAPWPPAVSSRIVQSVSLRWDGCPWIFSNIFIQENAFENVFLKMAAIVSRPQYVKHTNAWYHPTITRYCNEWHLLAGASFTNMI